MTITQKLDELGLPAWIALMILGFIVWWPLGLLTLAFLIWSGRMNCGHRSVERWQEKINRMQAKMDRARDRMGAAGFGGGGFWQSPSSGNRAFDEYRMETLRRLEDEQREFQEFLTRLRMAKDKAEFDQFMADRRRGSDIVPPAQG